MNANDYLSDVKGALTRLHQNISGIESVFGIVRKLETAMLPAICIRTGECNWILDNSGAIMQVRTFHVECFIEPLTQNTLIANSEQIDMFLQRFGAAYCAGYNLTPGSWIALNTVKDSGLQIIELGINYIGFTFTFNVHIRHT